MAIQTVVSTPSRCAPLRDTPSRSTKMERIHKIGIGVGLVILALVALYRIVPVKEPNYTAEVTVELIRVDPESLDKAEEKVIEGESKDDSTLGKQAKVEPAGTGQPM